MRITTPAGTTVSTVRDGDTDLVVVEASVIHDGIPTVSGYLVPGGYAPTDPRVSYGPHVLRAIADLIEETQK